MIQLPSRQPGWRGRLYAWLTQIADKPHVYGEHDCALFGAGVIQAMHGVDLAASYRHRYTTWSGGLRALRAAGFDDHIAVLRAHACPVAVGAAQIGDLVVVDTAEHPAVGVVTGPQIQMLRPEGLATRPLIEAGPTGPVNVAREVWRT